MQDADEGEQFEDLKIRHFKKIHKILTMKIKQIKTVSLQDLNHSRIETNYVTKRYWKYALHFYDVDYE